jgi:hypothetical protein
MRNLILGIVLGSSLTAGLGLAGTNLYNRDGAVQAPNGSQQSFYYFRQRQSWLDLAATRKATEQMARENQLHPCAR